MEHLLADRPVDKLRAVQGIVGYIERVGAARLEAACARALFYGDPHYRRIKSILNAGLDEEPLPDLPSSVLPHPPQPPQPPQPPPLTKPTGSFAFARRADEFLTGLLSQIGQIGAALR